MGGASAIQLVCIDVEKFLPERDVHVDTIKRHVLNLNPQRGSTLILENFLQQ